MNTEKTKKRVQNLISELTNEERSIEERIELLVKEAKLQEEARYPNLNPKGGPKGAFFHLDLIPYFKTLVSEQDVWRIKETEAGDILYADNNVLSVCLKDVFFVNSTGISLSYWIAWFGTVMFDLDGSLLESGNYGFHFGASEKTSFICNSIKRLYSSEAYDGYSTYDRSLFLYNQPISCEDELYEKNQGTCEMDVVVACLSSLLMLCPISVKDSVEEDGILKTLVFEIDGEPFDFLKLYIQLRKKMEAYFAYNEAKILMQFLLMNSYGLTSTIEEHEITEEVIKNMIIDHYGEK